MSEFDNFVNSLTDHELAIFVGYRYQGFLNNSKEKIDDEIKRRNLSREKLETLFHTKIDTETTIYAQNCQRCGSNKLLIETDFDEKPITEFSSVEVAVDTIRCRLCGFNPDKRTPKNLFEKIRRIFKNNKSIRINNWNEI